jgi:hypothetical protein
MKACLFGTHIDYGRSYGSEACSQPKAPGADYCAAHLKRAKCCVVRYCPEELHPQEDYERLCELHLTEYQRQTKALLEWLASRRNPHADRVDALPGFVSLESIMIVLGFVLIGLFLVSFLAIIAGGLFDDPTTAILGSLGFIGALAFFAFLVASGGKKGGPND